MNLQQIKSRYADAATRFGGMATDFPLATVPPRDEGEYLALDEESGTAALVYVERGKETLRQTTRDPDELCFWLFKDYAKARGWTFEKAHRHPTHDSRRIVFKVAVAELAKVSPEWSDRLKAEFDVLLEKAPFYDRDS